MRLRSNEDYILTGRWEVIDDGINLEHHQFENIATLRFENNGDLPVIAVTKYVKGILKRRDYQENDFITYKRTEKYGTKN